MNPITDALEMLRRDGWRKGAVGFANRPRCMIGALTGWEGEEGEECMSTSALYATPYRWVESNIPRTVQAVITSEYHDRVADVRVDDHVIAAFNDHPDTTFGDVERVMEKAALVWDEPW